MSAVLSPEALEEVALVPSDGRPGRVYTVRDALTNHPTCDCPDWVRRRIYTDGICKHVQRVRRAVSLMREARALLEPPPSPARQRAAIPRPVAPDLDGTPW